MLNNRYDKRPKKNKFPKYIFERNKDEHINNTAINSAFIILMEPEAI